MATRDNGRTASQIYETFMRELVTEQCNLCLQLPDLFRSKQQNLPVCDFSCESMAFLVMRMHEQFYVLYAINVATVLR